MALKTEQGIAIGLDAFAKSLMGYMGAKTKQEREQKKAEIAQAMESRRSEKHPLEMERIQEDIDWKRFLQSKEPKVAEGSKKRYEERQARTLRFIGDYAPGGQFKRDRNKIQQFAHQEGLTLQEVEAAAKKQHGKFSYQGPTK